jgi:hypothetical protein
MFEVHQDDILVIEGAKFNDNLNYLLSMGTKSMTEILNQDSNNSLINKHCGNVRACRYNHTGSIHTYMLRTEHLESLSYLIFYFFYLYLSGDVIPILFWISYQEINQLDRLSSQSSWLIS